jgi:CheY-like chemotaxis protein
VDGVDISPRKSYNPCMTTRVLIIDPDESFATLLKEGLEADREFQAVITSNAPQALVALQPGTFDLVIIDLGLENPAPETLLRAIRDFWPDLPVMVIPADGDIVPQALVPFGITGVLTKPFFLPDLPVRVAEALGRLAPAPTPMPAAPDAAAAKSSPAPIARALPRITLPQNDPRVLESLRALAEALNADAVLLTQGNTLADFAGQIVQSDAEALARRMLEARPAAAQPAWLTGTEQVRFGQSILDSGEHLLYSLDVAEGIVLTVAVKPESSLRLIRTQARQTARALLALST